MTDSSYVTVALDDAVNAPLDLLPAEHRPTLGLYPSHGLPFSVGPTASRCLVHLGGGGAGEARVSLGIHAHHLVFAHRLLTSDVLEGDPPGRPTAELLFAYEDGAEVSHMVRERFEVGALPALYGLGPFLAVPDLADELPADRWSGEYGLIGRRQMESPWTAPRCFYLWAWRNPCPEVRLDSLVVRAAGPGYVIASIVAGLTEESPLRREAPRTLRVTLTDPAESEAELDWRVEIDRGVATYPYLLPRQSVDEFLADELAGFGDPFRSGASPAYVEVSAVASATLSIRRNARELGSLRWRDLLARGRVDSGDVAIEVMQPERNWVQVTVLDDETAEQLPCRVHFRSPEGVPFQPQGHQGEVNRGLASFHSDVGGDVKLGSTTYAYIDGQCEGWLPRGDMLVDVARGFEYEPLRDRIRIEPGQRELVLRLRRIADMFAERWFSGDTHVHFLSARGAEFEARGEDLNVVNLLLSNWGEFFSSAEEFMAEPYVSKDGRTIVCTGQENRQHVLGHLTLVGQRQPVAPWGTDGPHEGRIVGTLEATLSDWADRCHAQGGTVIIPHLPWPNGEPATLIATGRADAVEMHHFNSYAHLEYYRYLNGGYRLPLVGGTDKMSSDIPVGLYRTYVYVPPGEEFTYDSWCHNIRAGRTFLSSGPLLSFSVDGAAIGDLIRAPRGGGTVDVEAEVRSIFPVHCLQIVERGKVVAETRADGGARQLSLRQQIRVDGETWLAARAAGPDYGETPHRDVWARGIMAHTSPIYVTSSEQWRLHDPATTQYMVSLIEGSLAYVREVSRQHAQGTVHHHGEADHSAYLSRPFLEALVALSKRAL